jgi:hypothetical protein
MGRLEVEWKVKEARKNGLSLDLSGIQMIAEDLSGIDFSSGNIGAGGLCTSDLTGADFRNARLSGCDLSYADLASANLRGADLRGSILSAANLYTALLESANMEGTILKGANLISAEMQSVKINGADFEGAQLGLTSLGGVDLSGAINLDLATHFRPSAISSETMRMTAAGLTSKTELERRGIFRFLSNSGVDDELLNVVRSWIGSPIEFHSVFLSHSSLDKVFARKLYSDLRSVGVSSWFDEKQIFPGDNILDHLDQGIKVWDKLLLVCSVNSLSPKTGWWVEQELERSLAKERESRRTGRTGSTLIPITLDDYIFDAWNSRFKASVIDKHVGDFRGWLSPKDYAIAFERLRSSLDANRSNPRHS